jgi:hypothetical protein
VGNFESVERNYPIIMNEWLTGLKYHKMNDPRLLASDKSISFDIHSPLSLWADHKTHLTPCKRSSKKGVMEICGQDFTGRVSESDRDSEIVSGYDAGQHGGSGVRCV